MQNKTERIVITVDAELKQELTEKANAKRIPLSGLGRNLLVEWLEQQK
jgi:ribbon-helix-helix protein, copG family